MTLNGHFPWTPSPGFSPGGHCQLGRPGLSPLQRTLPPRPATRQSMLRAPGFLSARILSCLLLPMMNLEPSCGLQASRP